MSHDSPPDAPLRGRRILLDIISASTVSGTGEHGQLDRKPCSPIWHIRNLNPHAVCEHLKGRRT